MEAVKSNQPQREELSLVTVNMNGCRFEMTSKIFTDILTSAKLELSTIPKNNKEFYFDRNVSSFRMILEYFQHGELHQPDDVCCNIFQRELIFWGLIGVQMAECCHRKMISFQDDQRMLKIFNQTVSTRKKEMPPKTEYLISRIKWNLWCILDKPNSSKFAKAYLVLSVILVIISLFVMAASTHPHFTRQLQADEFEDLYEETFGKRPPLGMGPPARTKRDAAAHGSKHPARDRRNPLSSGSNSRSRNKRNSDDTTIQDMGPVNENITHKLPIKPLEFEEYDDDELVLTDVHVRQNYLTYMEYTAMAFFTVELILRLIVCPSKYNYFKSAVNIFDIIALSAMYIKLLVDTLLPAERYSISLLDFIECLQVVRLFRFFRVVKDVIGFRVLIYTIRMSTKELCLLVMYLMLCVVLFSGIVYYCERTNMKSIPDAMWWVVITMTTVGYGDMSPQSYLGKVVGGLVAMCGILLIAVTIPVFVNNFTLFYNYSKILELDIDREKTVIGIKTIKVKPQQNTEKEIV